MPLHTKSLFVAIRVVIDYDIVRYADRADATVVVTRFRAFHFRHFK